MVLDTDKVCRLCLELCTNSIFYSEDSGGHQTSLNSALISQIFECTALKVVTGDGMPGSVCESCIRLVNKFVLFRKMCWEADSKLRQYLFSEKGANQEQLTSLSNPVRLDADQLDLPMEAKTPWMCEATQIKGEEESWDDGDDHDNDESDEDYHPTSSVSKSSKQYCCDICNESFKTLSDLKSHKEEEHPSEKKSKSVMTCHYCNKSFKQMKRYKDHLKSHTDPEDSEKEGELGKGTTEGDSTGGKKRKFRKVYDCEYCDQVFHSYAKFTQHELMHTGEKKYNCSDCSRSFTHKHSLIGHIKEQHTGEVNFTCDVCGRGFVHQSTFNIHKKTHSTEKPLKCPDCGKCFTQMKNLRVHRQIHSSSRSHTCQVCGKSFNFLKTLKVHLILHSGEKPYVCTYCGKGFAQSAPLKTHTRIHTGEKPYQCTLCPLRFSTNNSLKSHVLKHSGEAPYSCEVCSRGFSRKKDMVAHQEETHCVYIGVPGVPSVQTPPNHVDQHLSIMTPVPSILIVPDHPIETPPPLTPVAVPHLQQQHQPHIPHPHPLAMAHLHAPQPHGLYNQPATDCSGG